ncbi:ash family protein [Arsenophonus nasoniae]|uniref:ash family protein n=1 Tax=Arsenophonus nasoniae TaxID=638 RepID=UPI00387A1EF7
MQKNNHSSLRGTVNKQTKRVAHGHSEHQGNISLMMRLPDNIQLVGLPKEQSAKYFADDYDNFIKNSLPVCKSFGYSNYALVKSSDRFGTLVIKKATLGAKDSVFFYVVNNALLYSMVALLGQSFDWLVSFLSSSSNPDNVTALIEFGTSSGDFLNNKKEIALMATIPSQTHLKETKFTDTYWIIRLDSNIPYGKVSLTRRERRLFHVLFKDDRLVWSGRKPITPQSIIACSASQRQEVAYV